MPGRPRKPTAQRILEGNAGKRPIPKEPVIPPSDGEPPSFLPKEAKALYEEFLPNLATVMGITKADEPAAILLASTWGVAMKALRKLEREGLVIEGTKNPAAQIWKDNVALCMQMLSKFGMSPVDRARLFANVQAKEEIAGEQSTLDGSWKLQKPAVQ